MTLPQPQPQTPQLQPQTMTPQIYIYTNLSDNPNAVEFCVWTEDQNLKKQYRAFTYVDVAEHFAKEHNQTGIIYVQGLRGEKKFMVTTQTIINYRVEEMDMNEQDLRNAQEMFDYYYDTLGFSFNRARDIVRTTTHFYNFNPKLRKEDEKRRN